MRTGAELHADAMAGGPEAFSPIVERYQDAVFGIALARVRDFHEAEDIAQSAFVEAFERLDSLKDPARQPNPHAAVTGLLRVAQISVLHMVPSPKGGPLG
jgi:DNA-directed RNA polymerase specialized sigma24 family protein